MLKANGHEMAGKTVSISGSGNVALYALKKATELGAKVVTVSDSAGWIYDEKGVDFETVLELKEKSRQRIKEYVKYHPHAVYTEGRGVWSVKTDIALPCATQNDIAIEDAKALLENGVLAIGEGANMPTTNEALRFLLEKNVLIAPAKAANAGGVATSALEMSQNSMRYSWTSEEVDAKLHEIMVNIHKNAMDAAAEYGLGYNLVAGANIAGFKKVAEAMMAQGNY